MNLNTFLALGFAFSLFIVSMDFLLTIIGDREDRIKIAFKFLIGATLISISYVYLVFSENLVNPITFFLVWFSLQLILMIGAKDRTKRMGNVSFFIGLLSNVFSIITYIKF